MSENLRKMIIEELHNQKKKAGDIWKFEHYYLQFRNSLTVPEQGLFEQVIQKLCDEGIFEILPYGIVNNLRITEKGANLIYS